MSERKILATVEWGERAYSAMSPEYRIYRHMIGRCHCTTDTSYHRYGGRGIVVCTRWRESYAAFLADMGRRPSEELSLERKDNDGPYDPDNCVWATRKEQGRNRRSTRWVEHFGKSVKLIELADHTGISFGTLRFRYEAGDRDDKLIRPVEPVNACKRGHNFENGSYRINVNGARECKVCERLRYRARSEKRGVVPRKAVADWGLPSKDSLITRRSA